MRKITAQGRVCLKNQGRNRERHDYRQFLKKLAVLKENSRLMRMHLIMAFMRMDYPYMEICR